MSFTPGKDPEEVLRAIAANFRLEGLVLDEKTVAVLKRHLAGQITEENAINELLSDLVPEARPASGGGNRDVASGPSSGRPDLGSISHAAWRPQEPPRHHGSASLRKLGRAL